MLYFIGSSRNEFEVTIVLWKNPQLWICILKLFYYICNVEFFIIVIPYIRWKKEMLLP